MQRYLLVLLAVLLAVSVQHVSCLRDTWSETLTSMSHVEYGTGAKGQQPSHVDPCETHGVACNPTAFGARPVIIVSCLVSVFVMAPSIMRVWNLKKSSRSQDDTLFWWHLLFGSGGFSAWVYYFWECQADSGFTAYPIFAASVLLFGIHFFLLCWATVATSGTGDWRLALMFVGPMLLWAVSYGIWHAPIKYVGWWGFTMTALAHSFRVGSINYRDNSAGDVRICGLSMTQRIFFGLVSCLGAVSGLLWLTNPMLCFSLQYKLTSYAIALCRVWETVKWCPRVSPLLCPRSKVNLMNKEYNTM